MSIRVLLVEDNAMNSELIGDLLACEGHQVELAGSGAALRARVAAGAAADVVLMDIQLPDADGATLLRELRRVPRFAAVPVVAVTAHALAGDAGRLRDAGFAEVITKPIDTRTFVGAVVRLVDAARAAGGGA